MRAVLTIDLHAIRANYRTLKVQAPRAEVAAVLKADGYGLGCGPIADALIGEGCRSFFVATAEEALSLRSKRKGIRIHLLNGPDEQAAPALAAKKVTPVLNSPAQIGLWAKTAKTLGQRLPAALHLDTGMCRLGLSEREQSALDLDHMDAIGIDLIMSHLACADEPGHDLNQEQHQAFLQRSGSWPGQRLSLANSAGIFLSCSFHFDLVRPGIALFGGNPIPEHPNPMSGVVTISAPILQIHQVTKAGSVGYGASYRTKPGMRIATLGIGYADGVLRQASNRATATLRDWPVPFAGRVSMDLIGVDVTDVPETVLAQTNEVTLLAGDDGIDRMAAAANTIPYEVLTRLGPRLERRYVNGAASA
ncbi:MAG: alanine racemase [Geminicoccaceae bacterium]